MKDMSRLKEMLCKEVDEIQRKGDLSAGDLETLHKLTDTIKNIDKIEMLEKDGGYSRDGDWEARGRFGHGHSYNDGYSERRDSRGRYSRDDGGDYSHRGYSRGEGKDNAVRELKEIAKTASGRTREEIMRAIENIESR